MPAMTRRRLGAASGWRQSTLTSRSAAAISRVMAHTSADPARIWSATAPPKRTTRRGLGRSKARSAASSTQGIHAALA
jgi:hypothetical protein